MPSQFLFDNAVKSGKNFILLFRKWLIMLKNGKNLLTYM